MGRLPKIPPKDKNKIQSIYKKLNSITPIADMYGVTPTNMWRYLGRVPAHLM